MQRIKRFFKSITLFEYLLWGGSVTAIVLAFVLCRNTNYYSLTASLIGVTALILVAKGNVAGQFLSIVFAAFYGVVSYAFRYYGEMVTYLGMTAPIAVATAVVWLKHPFSGNNTQVKINRLSVLEYALSFLLGIAVSVAFYFILRAFDTANLIWSTASVFTSFYAVYLSLRRSPYYAAAYAVNDVVLIVLWSLTARSDTESVAMIVCFSAFLLNDLYGFVNWLRMQKKQQKFLQEKSE